MTYTDQLLAKIRRYLEKSEGNHSTLLREAARRLNEQQECLRLLLELVNVPMDFIKKCEQATDDEEFERIVTETNKHIDDLRGHVMALAILTKAAREVA